jgi:hypothetical protein
MKGEATSESNWRYDDVMTARKAAAVFWQKARDDSDAGFQ